MKFHVLTLFPEMIEQGLHTSITGRAIEKGILSLNTVNIRDFAGNRHGKVDDYPYGGGAGMVMQAEPVYRAYQSVREEAGRPLRTVYLTPQGRTFSQKMAEELAKEEELVFLCGHYEGIDERVLEEIVTDFVSIGDYVLTGGELPAMVMIDTISRLVEGVLNNQDSAQFESFQDSLLEYPQYSRPEVWRGKEVPPVLLSGHHANISAWRRRQSVSRTAKWRPDLLRQAALTETEKEMLKGEGTMFEDLGKKLGDLAQNVGDLAQNMVKKTGEVAEIASLRTKILAKKKKADDAMAALGRAYYEAHRDDTTEFAEQIVSINDIYNEIAALEEEIKTLKEKLPEEEKQFADDVVKETEDIINEAKKAVTDAVDAANDAIKDAAGQAEENAEGAAKTVEEAAEAVAETAEETVEAAEEAAEETPEAAPEKE